MNLKVAKIMGLDLGSKTCGVSLSDGLKMFAHPYKTLYYEGNLEEFIKGDPTDAKDLAISYYKDVREGMGLE